MAKNSKRDSGNVVRDSQVVRLHRQTLVEMNAPVFTARRNAAHERVLELLRRDMLSSSKERRGELYALCGRLLDEAVESTLRSQLQADSPVLHYLTLLRETLSASQALVHHEMTLVRESEQFAKMLNEYVVQQLRTADSVFSDSERNLLDCVEDLVKFGEPILAHDTEERTRKLTADDRRRYDIAMAAYRTHYRSLEDGPGRAQRIEAGVAT